MVSISRINWINKIKLQHQFISSLYSAEGLRCHNPDRDQGENVIVLIEAKIGDGEIKP